MSAPTLSRSVFAIVLSLTLVSVSMADDATDAVQATPARYPFAIPPNLYRYPFNYRYNFYRPRRYPFGTQYYNFAPLGLTPYGGYTGNLYNPNVYGFNHGMPLFGVSPYTFAPGAPPGYGAIPFSYSNPGPYWVTPTWSQGFGIFPNHTWGYNMYGYGLPAGPGYYGPPIGIFDDYDLRFDDYGGYIGREAFLQGW